MKHRNRIYTALLLFLTVLAYLPAMRGEFIWDDLLYVSHNETLQDGDGLVSIWTDPEATPQYYPLVYTGFWIEHQLWGGNPVGYHITNILLHAANALLLWLLLRHLHVPGAWFAAAVFALHPVHVESVAWISERKNTLSGFFYLAAALAFLRSAAGWSSDDTDDANWRLYVLSVVLFLCALLSKTVTASLPAALLLVLWWKRGHLTRSNFLAVFPMFAIGVPLGLFTAWLEKHDVGAHGADWAFSIYDRILIAGRAVCFYAGKIVWPRPIIFNYPRWQIDAAVWWQWLFPLAVLAVIAELWRGRLRYGRGPLIAVLFFTGTLVPALGFIDVFPMLFSFVADHFQYLASIGVIGLIVAVVTVQAERFDLQRIALLKATGPIVLMVLGVLTWQQSLVYKDHETLWNDTIRKNPESWLAHFNLAGELELQERASEALDHYRKTVELKPDHQRAHELFANCLFGLGRHKESLFHYRKALSIQPDPAVASSDLYPALTRVGIMYVNVGQLPEAAASFRKALELQPQNPRAHCNLALASVHLGDLEQAVNSYGKAIEIAPDFAEAYNSLGQVLLQQGRRELAVEQFREALRLDPNLEAAKQSLAAAESNE